MYYDSRNIWTYSSYENNLGLINSVSESAEVFWILCPGHSLSGQGYYDGILMYVDKSAKYGIDKIQTTSHLHLYDSINSNINNFGSLIDMYNDWFIPRILRFYCYKMSTTFIIM